PNMCNVSNVTASLFTLSGNLLADLDPTTPTPPMVSWAFNTQGIKFVPDPSAPSFPFAPIGTPMKTHFINWWNIYGGDLTLAYKTNVIVGTNCPPLTTSSVTSPAFAKNDLFGASGVTSLGPPSVAINSLCTLTRTDVELWSNDDSQRLSGPGPTTSNS